MFAPNRACRPGRFTLACVLAVPGVQAQSSPPVPSPGPSQAAPVPPAGGTHGPGAPCAGQVAYLSTSRGALYRIDDYWTNPTAVLLGDTALAQLLDIAVQPGTGDVFGDPWSADLYSIDPATLQVTLIAPIDVGAVVALDFGGDGTLYGWQGTSLLIIDPASGVTTFVGDVGFSPTGDLAVDRDGTLLGAASSNELVRIDPVSGAGTSLGTVSLNGALWGLEVDCDGTVYGFVSNGDVVTIDLATLTPTLLGNLGITEVVYGAAFHLAVDGNGSVGTNYCGPANLNSTGQSAVISGVGSTVVASNNLTLTASVLPPNQFGYFVNSMTQGFKPFAGGSQGNLCLAGSIGRHNKQVQSSGTAGEFSIQVDLIQLPQPGGPVSVQPGETWNFQAWFRDKNPSNTSNFTDGLSITFR